jgi:autotransporter passenger strand-loop-strand repeat protein
MSEYILSSGTASDTTIGNGGYTEIDAGGTAANTLIQGGGVLNVASGGTASGAIEFAGSGGTLDMAVSALPNAVVRGFAPGDVIDFTTIANGSAKLLLNNVLEISNGATTATLQLDPSQPCRPHGLGAGIRIGHVCDIGATYAHSAPHDAHEQYTDP